MSYEECAGKDHCILQGQFSIVEVDHVFMGQLILSSGECVNISLSDRQLHANRRNVDKQTAFQGDRLPVPVGLGEVDFLEVDGRRVGINLCGNYYLFVDG